MNMDELIIKPGPARYFKRSHFVFVLFKEYILEFDFEMLDAGIVEIVVKYEPFTIINWKQNAKEIKRSTFEKHYREAKKCNPFTPKI